MSNWFFLYYSDARTQFFRKKKTSFIFTTISMIMAGTWLVFYLLTAQGIRPFQTTQKIKSPHHLEAYFS
jgi:hypothetical protein